MNYWLDLFTGTTWEEFRKAGVLALLWSNVRALRKGRQHRRVFPASTASSLRRHRTRKTGAQASHAVVRREELSCESRPGKTCRHCGAAESDVPCPPAL